MRILQEQHKVERIKQQVNTSTEFKRALEYFDGQDDYQTQDESFEITYNVKQDFDNSFAPPNSSKNATDMKYLLESGKNKTEIIELDLSLAARKSKDILKAPLPPKPSCWCFSFRKPYVRKIDHIDYNNIEDLDDKL